MIPDLGDVPLPPPQLCWDLDHRASTVALLLRAKGRVCLFGAPGSGKRCVGLALKANLLLHDLCRDGVLWLRLPPAACVQEDPSSAWRAVVQRIGQALPPEESTPDPADTAAPPPRGRATDAGTLADEAQLLRQLAGKAILLIVWGVVQSHQSLLDHLTVLLPPPSRLHPRPSVLVLAESPIVGLEGCHLSALSPTGCHQLLCNAWPSTTDGHEVAEAVRHYADGDLPLFHFLARAIAALCPSPSDSEASSPGVAEIIHWLRSAPGVEGPRGWLGHAMDHLLPRLVPDAHQEAVGSLVVFPPEVPLPVDMLRKYWGWCRDRWSDFDVQTFLERLCSLGLLRCVTRSVHPGAMPVPQFSVPAWLGAYLATRYSPLPWHRVVYDGYAALCESVGDWDSVPDDGYFYQHFPHHCAALGQPAPRPHWRRALLPSVSLTGLELAALLAALPAPDAAALVASLCFLAVRAPSSEQRLHTQRTLASCFGEEAVYEGVWRQLRSCATPGDVAAFLRCLPNVSGAEVDVVADLALYGAATPAPGVQQMVRSLFRRGYDAGRVNEGLTVALQRLAESPVAAAEPTAFLLAALVPPADAAVPPGLLAAVLGHALGASPAPGPAAQAAQAFLRQCRGSRLLFDRLLPMLDEDLPGGHTITAQVLECLPSLTDLAGSAAIDQVVRLAFEARTAACAAAARRLLRRSPGREYVARAVSHAVERAIAEGPARAEQDALAVALAALPEGSANAVSPAVAQYLLQLATAAEGSVPVTLAHQAQQLLVTTAQCSAAYHAIGEWKAEEAARQVQVLVSRCLDLHLHPPAATQLPVLFALAVGDGDGGAAGAAAEAQGQLRRLSGHTPEPLKQLHGLVQEALSNILFSPAVEGPRRTVRAINCLACLSTLHTAPPPLVQMVLELHAGQTLQSPGLHAMATRLLLTCEGPELDWQLLPPDFDTGPGEELRALLPALLRHPDEAYAAQALVRLTTQHTDPSMRGAAQALLPAVPDQTLVAQRLYDVLRAHAPQTAAEVIMAAVHGDSLAPDAVLQNALDAWPRPHIAGTASLEMLDAALRLALHAPLEATSAAARAVLRHCPGVTHVYRQLAAHLSLVHSNGALLHRALQSFPNLTFAEDEVLDQVWQIALRHHSPAVCDAARALLRTCAGHLHVYRLVTQLLDQDGDDRAGAVAAEDLCCALDSCPPLTVADESTFHAVLLRVQSPHAAVQRAARRHFREVDPAAGPAAVVHVCGQLTRVLRCLGDLGLRPRSHIPALEGQGAGEQETGLLDGAVFHPAAPLGVLPRDRYLQRMHRVGDDPSQFVVRLLQCYPALPAHPLLDDTVALLVDLAVLAKDEDVKRESARLLRESLPPQPTLCHALLALLCPLPQDYAVADVLRALPDLSAGDRASVDLICGWYNHPHCLVRSECHALLRRSSNAPLVYEWFDRAITPDTPDADLLLLVAALPAVQRASVALRDQLVCLTEERRDPAVLRTLTACLAPILG